MFDIRQMSYPEYDAAIAEMIRRVRPDTFLDIGAGLGKYGKMVETVWPIAHRTGLEAFHDLAVEAAVHYDAFFPVDVSYLMEYQVRKRWDLVIMGDCLEHFTKSQGIDLLDFLVYRSKWIVLSYPLGYLQDVVEGNPYELHQSIWSPRDLDNYTSFWTRTNKVDVEEQGDRAFGLCFVVLRGYLAEQSIESMVAGLPVPEGQIGQGIWERGR